MEPEPPEWLLTLVWVAVVAVACLMAFHSVYNSPY